jgi:hypothetical protein
MKRPKQRKTIRELIQEYFQQHPNTDLPHGPVVDWVTEQWRLQGNETPPRDPWRMIRRLHQEGWLIKVRKGVYRYDPESARRLSLTTSLQNRSKRFWSATSIGASSAARDSQTG